METTKDMGQGQQDQEKGSSSSSIQVCSLHFSYMGQPPFIANFSVNVPPRSRVLLVGANGQKPNIRSSNNDPFLSDGENIHLAAWTKDESYDSLLINAKSKGKHSQFLNYNAVVRKLTYEERDFKGVTVNIYQKPQALINYLIDTFSREGDWVLDLFSGSGTTIACALQKGRNCISIDNDPLQCNYIKQRVNAIPVLPDELQEVGLKKGEFSETLVAKMSKEPQPPLGGVFGKDHFGHLADIEDPMEEEIVVPEESQAPDNSNLDEEFGMHDLLD